MYVVETIEVEADAAQDVNLEAEINQLTNKRGLRVVGIVETIRGTRGPEEWERSYLRVKLLLETVPEPARRSYE